MERITLDPELIITPLTAQVAALERAVQYLTETVELQRREIVRLTDQVERLKEHAPRLL